MPESNLNWDSGEHMFVIAKFSHSDCHAERCHVCLQQQSYRVGDSDSHDAPGLALTFFCFRKHNENVHRPSAARRIFRERCVCALGRISLC